MLITSYKKLLSNPSLISIPRTRSYFAWVIRGYRPNTSKAIQALRSSHKGKPAFVAGSTVRDQTRWLALYCTDEDFNLRFLMQKTKLRRNKLDAFFAYYGVDMKTRNLIKNGGAN